MTPPSTSVSSHIAHVQAYLQVLRAERQRPAAQRAEIPLDYFLGEDRPEAFRELVAFRLRGCPTLLVGLFQFRRQPSVRQAHARRSLVNYLNQPPKELGINSAARPEHLLEVRLPEPGEPIPEFLRRDRRGERGHAIFVDVNSIQLAFDFRLDNPSESLPGAGRSAVSEAHVFRTVEGHLLLGRSQGLHTKLHRDGEFIALAEARQIGPGGERFLPNLAIRRSFLALDAQVPLGVPVAEWLRGNLALLPEAARPEHVLVPTALSRAA